MAINSYKLYFEKNTVFHFGNNFINTTKYIFPSDSFVSAIVYNYLNFSSKEITQDGFLNNINSISSVFFGFSFENKNIFFLPIFKGIKFGEDIFEKDRKIIKKVKFLSKGVLDLWNDKGKDFMNFEYIDFIDNYNFVVLKEEKDFFNLKKENIINTFIEEKVKLITNSDNELFSLESFSFNVNLNPFFYFIVDTINLDLFENGLDLLIKNGGLGGKVSVGKGLINRFERFNFSFKEFSSNNFLSLGSFIPNKLDFENNFLLNSSYKISSRKGFVYGFNVKRKDCFVFEESSIFSFKIIGSIVDLTPELFLKTFQIKRFCKPFIINVRYEGGVN